MVRESSWRWKPCRVAISCKHKYPRLESAAYSKDINNLQVSASSWNLEDRSQWANLCSLGTHNSPRFPWTREGELEADFPLQLWLANILAPRCHSVLAVWSTTAKAWTDLRVLWRASCDTHIQEPGTPCADHLELCSEWVQSRRDTFFGDKPFYLHTINFSY